MSQAIPLTTEAIKEHLHTTALGKTLYVHPLLASSNDTAKEIAPFAAHGTVVVADHQSAGRGRKGRSFFSPAGNGIYMSVILKENIPAHRVGLLTSAAAVAVARAIERLTDTAVQIKWVNDLLIHGKKVCGILTEGIPDQHSGFAFAVIGIGINVSTEAFPAELQNIASSLRLECAKTPDRAALIATVLEELETVLLDLESGAFLEETRRRSAVLGKKITVLRGNETFEAIATAIDDDGGLVVRNEKGFVTLCSGEVSLRL